MAQLPASMTQTLEPFVSATEASEFVRLASGHSSAIGQSSAPSQDIRSEMVREGGGASGCLSFRTGYRLARCMTGRLLGLSPKISAISP